MAPLLDQVTLPAALALGGTLVAVVVYLAVTRLVWPHRDRPGAEPLLGILLGAFVWTAAETGTVVATEPGTVLVFERLVGAGTTLTVLAWVLFALEYTGRDQWLTPRTLALLAVEPVAFQSLVWGGGFEGLVWTDTLWVEPVTNYAVTGYGPALWVHAVYSYALLVLGAYLLVDVSLSTRRLYRWRTAALLVGVFVPMTASVLYLSGIRLVQGVDQTAYVMVVPAAAFGWVVADRDLLEVVPVAPAVDHADIVERMDEGLVVVDAADRVVEYNAAAARLAAEQPGGRPVEATFPGLERVLDDDASRGGRVPLEDADGCTRHLQVSASPVRREGDDLGQVVTLHDVTDRVHRDQRIEVLSRVLRHNIRQEATLIVGHVDLLEEQIDDGQVHTGVVKEAAASIEAYSDQARTIERILAEANEGRTTIDLVETVDHAFEAVEDRHGEGAIAVDAPDAAPALVHSWIYEAVTELVENAVQHNDDPTVRVTVSLQAETVELRVADSGSGIPDTERVVVEKQRETPLDHASGLGLWMVSWIVEASGGDLTFGESDMGGGLVVLSLPRSGGGDADTDPDAAATDPPGEARLDP